MALNVGADSLFIQQQPRIQQQSHIDKQACERDGQQLTRSSNVGPAAIFSFSQQALDSARDAARSQPGIKTQVSATAPTHRAELDYGAQPVETVNALPATAEAAKAHATKADPPLRELDERAAAYAPERQVPYQDLLDRVPMSVEPYFS